VAQHLAVLLEKTQ